MASTKAHTAVENGLTLTAGAGDDTGASNDLTDGYGALLQIKITNGATAPTVAAQVQVQTSSDNSEWFDYGGPIVGNTDNNGVVSQPVRLDKEVMYVRTVQGSNTGQDVTLDIDMSEVTAVS